MAKEKKPVHRVQMTEIQGKTLGFVFRLRRISCPPFCNTIFEKISITKSFRSLSLYCFYEFLDFRIVVPAVLMLLIQQKNRVFQVGQFLGNRLKSLFRVSSAA